LANLVSVVVTTYERKDALEAVLRSLAQQSDPRFEVIVADDGSGPDTAALIEQWQSRMGVALSHAWQEHRDFRAGEIRNRAILQSQGDYCVFLDGDCVVPRDFVAIHRRLAEHGWFVTGNRALLSPGLTDAVLRLNLEPQAWWIGFWMRQRLRGELNRLAPVMRLPLGPLRKLRPLMWEGARTCNLGVWRSDLDQIDGFDASFSGWGREDSDLLVRLLRTGVRRKDGVFATGVFHLWHPDADRSRLADNDRLLHGVIESARVRAIRGMSVLNPQNSEPPPLADSRPDLSRARATTGT
jgi:glycosyltransferase involved in cell wall biosynthesis